MRTKGFTLVEVAIVTVVVVIVLLGVFATFNVADRARNFSAERDLAREACRAKLEELTELGAVNFPGLLAMHGTFFDVPETPSPTGQRLMSSVAGELPGRIVVASSPAPARPDLLKVTVQVRWIGHDGGLNVSELTTLVASGR